MTDTIEPVKDDELTVLKARADVMGIKYSPNIGVKSLRDKVNAILDGDIEEDEVAPTPSRAARHNAVVKEATKLVRIRLVNLNPNKKHSEGEWFRTGNSVVPTISRFIPFEHETHVENMLIDCIRSREYAIVREEKNGDGKKVPIRHQRKEFQLEILPDLTEAELKDLAIDQSKRQSV